MSPILKFASTFALAGFIGKYPNHQEPSLIDPSLNGSAAALTPNGTIPGLSGGSNLGLGPNTSTSAAPSTQPSPTHTAGGTESGQSPSTASSAGLGDKYTFYQGDGSTSDGWPSTNKWVDFETMWNANSELMNSSCATDGLASTNNSPAEIQDIQGAINRVSTETGVDKRFILAVTMQESKGCVRVTTTTSPGAGVSNPGLMQSHEGKGTCSGAAECNSGEINQMIKDGTAGTSAGDGLKQCLSKSNAHGATKYYQAARIYNSGSIAPSGNLGQGCATHCYASDIANRLTGWVSATSDCTLDQ